MCGIAGFYGFSDNQLIKKISQELSHRGPDGEGLYIDQQITLLNRRLAIIDLAGGNQPIYNEDQSLIVVYNGEIYNYQELKKSLEKYGHKFKTNSDTEIIVHGYEQWEDQCFDKFNGMFAIGLYDIKNKRLILARDHFGIKPLYYSIIDKDKPKVIFSSEIKPIINSGLIEKKPNDRVIYRYLKYRIHDDGEETFFENVHRLLPGYLMEIDYSRIELKKYTFLKEDLLTQKIKKNLTQKEIEDFKERLIKAIRLRLIADVSVGTCLSGGLDSSTVTTVVNKLLKNKIKEAKSVGDFQKTFSAVFPGEINDEERYIDELIKTQRLKIKNYKVKPTPEKFFEEINDFIKTQEEPTISTGPYAQYQVMREAAKHVKVLLDGQGADEMMAGYLPYYFVYLRQLLKEKKDILKIIKEIWGAKDILLNYFKNKILEFIGFKQKIEIDNLLNYEFINQYKKEKFVIVNDNLKKRLIEDIFFNSLQALLRYEDKNSMRFSLEGRVPFLDFGLIKYLFSLSDEAIIKDGWNKFILRQATKDLLPPIINQRRNKIGFTTPEYQWFMRMKNKIYSIFLSESFANRKYFNQQEVLKAFQKFIEGKIDDTMIFWRLLNLELWLRIFFDKSNKDYNSYKDYKKFGPNEGKKLEIEVDEEKYLRYPIRTEIFKKGDDYSQKIYQSLVDFFSQLKSSREDYQSLLNLINKNKFFLTISEKIIAITQGRSYFLWEIKPGFWARFLSKFVRKTPYGIGLGSSWTMQLAIQEVGLLRILLATVFSALTKPFGVKGVFYLIAGKEVASIDGPTEYSLYPSNVSAKLGPKNPEKVAKEIHQLIISNFKFLISKKNSKFKISNFNRNFLGVAIIDANDLGQKVLANTTNLDNKKIEKIFKDNPMGQADEQTPLVLVVS